jgi:aspartyl-tRNA(Asn)/glutamyl-tRNA(Gln) amidotransferase subunit A
MSAPARPVVAQLARRCKPGTCRPPRSPAFPGPRPVARALGAYLATDEAVTPGPGPRRRRAHRRGRPAPLLGVPIAHKDIFVTRDFPSTAGSKMLAGYRSPFDATVVRKLAEAGA